jgi:hypothetical protein
MTARFSALLFAVLLLAGCERDSTIVGPDLVSPAPSLGRVLYAVSTFDDGADPGFTFGPAGSVPTATTVPGEVGSGQQLAVTTPPEGGYSGGFGYSRPGGFAVTDETTLTLFVRPDPSAPFTLGIRIQDDDDGDGQILLDGADAIIADDEFGRDVVVPPGTEFRRLGPFPISSFADLNPGVGDGTFDPVLPANGGNGGFASVVFVLTETPASTALRFVVDEVAFYTTLPDEGTPTLTPSPASVTLTAAAGEASAARTVTLAYRDLTAAPTATASDGFAVRETVENGTLADGSRTYEVTFTGAAAAGETSGLLTFEADGQTATIALTGVTTDEGGGGDLTVYRDFESGGVADVSVFSQNGAGISTSEMDGAPETGGETALRVSVDPAQTGTFTGFVVPPAGGAPFAAAGTLRFYVRTSAASPYDVEINLHEDADASGTFDGQVDDEFQAIVTVTPDASGYALVEVPLADFTDDNSVFPGQNDGFDFDRLFEIVFALPNPSGAAFTLDVDDLAFSNQ